MHSRIFKPAIPIWQLSAFTSDSWLKWIALKNVKLNNESLIYIKSRILLIN